MSWIWLALLPLGPLFGSYLGIMGVKKFETQLSWFISFAGAYLLGITLLNLIPEVFQVFDPYKGVLVLVGFFFQIFLERYSEGLEHGHMHVHHRLKSKVIPIGIILSLSFHSFTEGIPLGALWKAQSPNFIPLLIGILIHEVPAAFAMLTLLRNLKISSSTLKQIGVIYSLMALTGACISLVIEASIPQAFFEYFMAFVVGTFLHISTTILFESSEHHLFNKRKLSAIILGIAVASLISLSHHFFE